MILDSYTFVKLPTDMTMLEDVKYASSKLTYTSVAYFSWGTTRIGNIIKLKWKGMTTTQFDILQTKYAADIEVVWDPAQGDARTYNVEIMKLTGKFHMSLLNTTGSRLNVEMDLLIMSEV